MIRARPRVVLFKLNGTRDFCSITPKSTNNANRNSKRDKIESSISKYDEAYRQLDKLDFMTATKILFNEPPKPRKFGIDFHLVQFFFACLPSLAVYLVAQYARHEMRKMDAELEQKKKEEEEKAKEMELKAMEEKQARSHPEISEVRERLDKLEEAVREIVVEAKKQSSGDVRKNQDDSSKKKHVEPTESGDTGVTSSESNKSLEKKNPSKEKAIELAPHKLKEQNSKNQNIVASEDTTKK